MNSEVKEFSDAARQVVDGFGLDASEDHGWSLVAELGWLLTPIPEDLDGLGMGLPGACALHRELGHGLAPIPLLPALLALDALCQVDLPGRQEWLGRLGSGEDYLAAPLGASQLVVDGGGDLVLSGTATALPSADRASHVLVWAAVGDALALVPVDQTGVTLTERETWDTSRRLFDVSLVDVKVEPGLVLARGAAAQALVERLLIWRDFALAAETVGSARALLEETIEYLLTRQQFGRPLAMFQALKHRCADLKALVEAADALLQDGLARATASGGELGTGSDVRRAGLAAKQLATEASAAVAEEALQLHGGIGMTAEHLCHRYLKRALLDEHLGRGRDTYDMALADDLLASVQGETL